MAYNRATGMMLCYPATTRIKNYPFEVKIAGSRPGAVLADQVKCQDWRARNAVLKRRVTPVELADIRAKLHALIG